MGRPLPLKLNSFSATATICFYIFSRLWWPYIGWVFCNTYPYNSLTKYTNQTSLQQTIYHMVGECISLVHNGERRGQRELAGRTRVTRLPRTTLLAWGGSSYSPGVVDADYSLSLSKTIRAWWKATSYEWWPCCAEDSGSKGVNL